MRMATGAGVLNPFGRALGSYVYMLMCAEGPDGILIKVGKANSPLTRVMAYLAGCTANPEILATAHVASSQIAYRLEAELHSAFEPWHVRGEWFRFLPADKPAFNAAWREAFKAFSSPSWRVKWTQLELQPALAELSRIRHRANARKVCPST